MVLHIDFLKETTISLFCLMKQLLEYRWKTQGIVSWFTTHGINYPHFLVRYSKMRRIRQFMVYTPILHIMKYLGIRYQNHAQTDSMLFL